MTDIRGLSLRFGVWCGVSTFWFAREANNTPAASVLSIMLCLLREFYSLVRLGEAHGS